jgi:hypothetical protein
MEVFGVEDHTVFHYGGGGIFDRLLDRRQIVLLALPPVIRPPVIGDHQFDIPRGVGVHH